MHIQVSITIRIKWNSASSLFCRCMYWKFHLHKYMETEGISASTVNFFDYLQNYMSKITWWAIIKNYYLWSTNKQVDLDLLLFCLKRKNWEPPILQLDFFFLLFTPSTSILTLQQSFVWHSEDSYYSME